MRRASRSLAGRLADSVADDATDFVERRRPLETPAKAVLPQGRHALLPGSLGELLGGAFDRGAHAALNGQDLVEGNAASVAGSGALQTTGGAIQRLSRLERQPRRGGVRVARDVRLAAMGAEAPREPLRDDAV